MPLNLQDDYAYYELKRVAVRWGMAQGDIINLAGDGEIELAVFKERLPVVCGQIAKLEDGRVQKSGFVSRHDGVLPLRIQDIGMLAWKDNVEIRQFRPRLGDHYRELDSDYPTLVITMQDIVVAYDEAVRFERELGLEVRELGKRQPKMNPQTSYNLITDSDYKVVSLGPHHWDFGGFQSNVVRLLHNASLTDQPWLFGKTLLSDAGSRSTQLGQLFKFQENWKELILSDKRGLYRLNCDPRLWLPDSDCA